MVRHYIDSADANFGVLSSMIHSMSKRCKDHVEGSMATHTSLNEVIGGPTASSVQLVMSLQLPGVKKEGLSIHTTAPSMCRKADCLIVIVRIADQQSDQDTTEGQPFQEAGILEAETNMTRNVTVALKWHLISDCWRFRKLLVTPGLYENWNLINLNEPVSKAR